MISAHDENGSIPCAQCGLPRGSHADQGDPRGRAAAEAADILIRDILESLCRRDGLSLESAAEPGEPARNYELADRLGIGHVFGPGEHR